MSGQIDSTAKTNGQAVQTEIQEGQWLSLKEAAECTGLSQKTLRRYVKKKTLKTRRLGKSTNSPIQVLLTKELLSMDEVVEQEVVAEATIEPEVPEEDVYEDDDDDSEMNFAPNARQDQFDLQREAFRVAIDECLRPLLSRIEEQSTIIMDKDRQLKLLPDLEKQAREKEEAANLKAFENEALKKQLELVKEEKESAMKVAKLSESLANEKEQITENLKAVQQHYAELEEENITLRKEIEEKLKLKEESKKQGFWSWFTGG